MKKKITILIVVLAIIFLTVFAYYLVSNSNKKVESEKKPAEKVKINEPNNFCYITYKVSTDNGKSWHKAILNEGVKPLSKAECWKRYLNKLKKFPTKTTEDGKWESKNFKNKILADPAMKFSNKPFEQVSKEKNKDSKDTKIPTTAK